MTDTPISREQAIEALDRRLNHNTNWAKTFRNGFEDAINIIRSLPPRLTPSTDICKHCGQAEWTHLQPGDNPERFDNECLNFEILSALPPLNSLREPLLTQVQRIVDEQAEDEGLWCQAANIVEAYLQQELRRLHAAIENDASASVEPESRSYLSLGIEALETRIKEDEQRAARNEFNDPEWEKGWLTRRRGMEDAIDLDTINANLRRQVDLARADERKQ